MITHIKKPLLRVISLTAKVKEKLHILHGVSFELQTQEICGLVGRSGCGKSTVAQSIIGLYDKEKIELEGKIFFKDIELLSISENAYRLLRGSSISMVFQDALSSLNPLQRIGTQIQEVMLTHNLCTKKQAQKKTIQLLNDVKLSDAENIIFAYPHELSGGMRQRVCLAMSLAEKPDLIIMDEATTSLDVTVQAHIINLIIELHKKYGFSLLFISHDLGVISKLCKTVLVMDQGRIVESGPIEKVFTHPSNKVTKELINEITFLRGKQQYESSTY